LNFVETPTAPLTSNSPPAASKMIPTTRRKYDKVCLD